MAENFDDIPEDQQNPQNLQVSIQNSQQLNPQVPSFDEMPESQNEPENSPTLAKQANEGQAILPDFDNMPDQTAQYSTPGQEAKTFAEHAAQGVVGPLAPLAEEEMGVNPKDILAREKANPWSAGLGEATGLAASTALSFGVAPALEAAGAGAEGLATAAGIVGPLAEDTSYGTAVGHSIIKGAIELGTLQGSDEVSKMVLHDPDTTAESAIANVGLATALGGAGGAFWAGAASPLWKATGGKYLQNKLAAVAIDKAMGIRDLDGDPLTMRPVLKRAFSVFLGVHPDTIDEYLANHAAVQSAPEFEDLYNTALDHVSSINDNLEAGKMSVKDAQDAYNAHAADLNQQLKERGYDAKQAAALSKQALGDAQTKLASDIQEQAFRTAPQISQAMENLRQSVIDGSQNAYDVLEKANVQLPLDPIYKQIEDQAQNLEGFGTPQARLQAQQLRSYSEGLQGMFPEGTSSGPQAKQLLQGLDRITTYSHNMADFDKGLIGPYKQIRGMMDDNLKSLVPGYKSAMKPVASDTELLKNLHSWGDDTKVIGKINGLRGASRAASDLPLLQQLEKRTGVQITQGLEPYINPDLQESLTKALPEYEEAQQTAAELQKFKNPEYKQKLVEAMNQELAASPQAETLQKAQENLATAKEAKAGLGGISERNLEARMNSLKRKGNHIESEKTLSKFPEFEGKSIPEMMNLLRLREAFTKSATHGSRNFFGYGAAGEILSHLILHNTGLNLGAFFVGGEGGIIADKYGPGMTKWMLDRYANYFGDLAENSGVRPGVIKRTLARVAGAEAAPNAEGFRAGADYINSVSKTQTALNKAATNVFSPGLKVLSTQMIPDSKATKKLDKLVSEYQPQQQTDLPGSLKYYFPEHAQAVNKASQQAIAYLQTLRPKTSPKSPLDSPPKIAGYQQARYDRALQIAQQPLLIMKFAKEGKLQLNDLKDLKAMYPSMYNQISQKINEAMINRKADGAQIPYRTRMGISMLMGQALDSTMSPEAIQASNPAIKAKIQAQQLQQAVQTNPKLKHLLPKPQTPKRPSMSATKNIGKMNPVYRTPVDASESRRLNSK